MNTRDGMTTSGMEPEISAWEDEGGSQARSAEIPMTGTVNQIAWAQSVSSLKRQVQFKGFGITVKYMRN